MATGSGRSRRPSRRKHAPDTVGGLIAACATRLDQAGVFFGHGTGNARDEAAALVFHELGLDHGDAEQAYRLSVTPAALARIETLLALRIASRRPLPYLTGEAWFAGLPFCVDERVLIPRSPFAELIEGRFEPWLDAGKVQRILEIGTGSGCIAVALALAFPEARVVASDISTDALAVAATNVARYGLEDRVQLLCADLFAGIEGTFDLIVSNPPYVPEGDLATFPPEYGHEPRLALVSGVDGMESPARILHHVVPFLTAHGWLALEVGAGSGVLETRFPAVPFLWPELTNGGDGIALVSAGDLRATLPVSN
ncbi:MAG: 50S ribosomal protein L3 N(5)-glutamine methyltransferase [Gammaproteobacteria bacterium]|nr:50S ribosomal protein L3 N(5)-glutamine methyltransferase [Gammaproteobacteria bacterium]